MASWLIVDKETRVWRNRTSDPRVAANPGPREVMVEVADDFVTPGPPDGKTGLGWWKVDDQGKFTEATAEERDAAFTAPERPETKAILDAARNLNATCDALSKEIGLDTRFVPLFDDLRALTSALTAHFKPKPRYQN